MSLRTRTPASLVAMLAVTLGPGACAHRPADRAPGGRVPDGGGSATIRFDNGAREHVHVYLVGEQREWLLGRVEPGARAVLRIPRDAIVANPGFVRLAVLAGERLTAAARNARATFAIAQPASAILSQRWMFAQGQLTSLQHPSAGADGRPP